ncbi:MAG: ATP-binding protein [Acidobacteriota bacterium]|nr:ATP-binding protein [Acidobacteriota bacterium]
MYGRLLSLIVFRLILLCLVMVYQLLALAVRYPPLAFDAVLYTMVALSILSGLYSVYLKYRWTPARTANFVFVQFIVDILAISVLVAVTGGVDSQLKFAYLIIILLSALFLERSTIYVLTILSLALYFLTLNLVQFILLGVNPFENVWVLSNRISQTTISQFVICFLTALLSGFMQVTYRSGRQTMLTQEARIRSLRIMHRKIIETLPSGLVTCERGGQIIFINAMGCRLLQLDVNKAMDANAWQLFAFQPDSITEIRRTGKRSRLETRVSVGHSRRIMGISYSPMELESGGSGYLIIFQDLTEIKMLEARKLMDDRMAAIGKMAAGVAHEIRNPLASISGSVQVLKELMPEGDEAADDLADIVTRETNRLNRIISEFLAYTRPAPPPDLKPIDLKTCVYDFVRLTRNDKRMEDLSIETEFTDQPAVILGDESQLNQVFWNLVRNSFHACRENGQVKVSVLHRDEDIILSFIDNGIGMTESQLKDLFTPFQSFSQTGTGLGMNIVYDIIQIHHGNIKVYSKPGKGTKVEMTFSSYEE